MKYLYQFCVIMIFVALGEFLGWLILWPIAGSMYGLILLFLALAFKIVKLSWVEGAANWLHSIMGLFFIPSAVAVITIWPDVAHVWWKILLLLILVYLVSMITTGVTAQTLIKDKKRKKQWVKTND